MADPSSVSRDMEPAEAANTAPDNRKEHEPESPLNDEETDVGGTFSDAASFFALISLSVRDTAQLLGLETRLVLKTVLMMMVLGMVLAVVIVGIWLSLTLILAAGLYEYTRLGMTLSIAVTSLVNVVCAKALLVVLKRLGRRLVFPETRVAMRTLLDDAARTMTPKE